MGGGNQDGVCLRAKCKADFKTGEVSSPSDGCCKWTRGSGDGGLGVTEMWVQAKGREGTGEVITNLSAMAARGEKRGGCRGGCWSGACHPRDGRDSQRVLLVARLILHSQSFSVVMSCSPLYCGTGIEPRALIDRHSTT